MTVRTKQPAKPDQPAEPDLPTKPNLSTRSVARRLASAAAATPEMADAEATSSTSAETASMRQRADNRSTNPDTAADAGTWWTSQMHGNSIPVPPMQYVQTESTRLIFIGVQACLKTGHITLVDGDFGVGKTTAVVEAARAATGVEAVYVNMFGVTSPRDALAIIWRAMTGEQVRKRVTASQLRDDLIEELKQRRVLLLIDDAHRLKSQSLETLINLWNKVHNDTRKGIPTVFIGNRLEKHLGATMPELISRSGMLVEAKPLIGKDAVAFLLQWEPGIAGTDPDLLVGINNRNLRGQIRNWAQFFDLVRVLRGEDNLDKPVTHQEAKLALKLLPTAGVN